MTGLLAELFLLAHYEDFKQWIPLAVLAAGIGALALELVHRRVWTLTVVRTVMAVAAYSSGCSGYIFILWAAGSFSSRWIRR